jgi:hypothetical protein
VLACHDRHAAYIGIEGTRRSWEVSFSHETIESTTDRKLYSKHYEICDHATGAYRIDGVWVSNWLLPDGRAYRRT